MFHKLKVSALQNPVKDAVSITFDVPESLYDKFSFYPGQHLIIKLNIDGEEVRRSYSLNSCPYTNEPLQVTVKRVKGGLVSNYLNDKLKSGDELEVMEPHGRFFADIHQKDYKTFFLFAAGSGITPVMSILKSVLNTAPKSVVNLFYGNSNQDTIIFKKELEHLQEQYDGRLNVVHTLSDPKVWSTWEQWKGKTGRIEADSVEWFINEFPPIAQHTEYFICGPGKMNVAVKKKLLELEIPADLIHIEQFGGADENMDISIEGAENAQLTANVNGQTFTTTIPRGATILKSLKAAKADPPYSCESGICATCVCKVTKGKAEMKNNLVLEEKDIQKGMVLACQAIPVTPEISVSFPD